MEKLAVILPHKDRDAYKEFQKEYLPDYLFRHGIEHKLFFSEQADNSLFSRSMSINVGFLYAVTDYEPTYVVIGDIDMVPLNIDYRYAGIAETWFGNAGGVKIKTNDFMLVNGFNNNFRGWGYEDSEFYFRLDTLGVVHREWKRTVPCGAEMVDLEMQSQDSRLHSLGYFGKENPRFYHPKEKEITKHITAVYPKTWLTGEIKASNAKLCDTIKALPKGEAIPYFLKNGLNQINLETISVISNSKRIAEVSFNSEGA